VEHGLPDEWAPQAAKLALESRAFPLLAYDPDAGTTLADCLSLEGNPSIDERWPTYELEYLDDAGETQRMELPVTIADWAATEVRFKKQFGKIPADVDEDDLVPFHEFVGMPVDERDGKRAFIYVLGKDRRLSRLAVSRELVELAEERLQHWSLLREMAGIEVSETVRDRIAERMEEEVEGRLAAVRAEYEAKLAELAATYPRLIARKLAEGLVRAGGADRGVADLLREAQDAPAVAPVSGGALPDLASLLAAAPAAPAAPAPAAPAAAPSPPPAAAAAAPAPEAGGAAVAVAEEDDELTMEPYVETARCTTCNECTNINDRMFVYDENKQAYIADARAGTFAQLVQAAEKCPAEIIHPGTPLNPKEKNLEKWIKRAAKFN
jgi:pyruvate-ferredoxin/flavodoxin oxidoreductase